MNPITLAQIGCGYWGPNLLRNFSAVARVKYVVEADESRRQFVRKNYAGVDVTAPLETVLADSEVDGLVIATPAANHFELARAALRTGKHVFVEKPLATAVAEVDELGDISQHQGLVVMAGHTFIYNNAVRYVKKLIDAGDLGDVRYIYSQRLNLGRIRSDIDALWNFAPHDISIIQYWLNDAKPASVTRMGMDYIQSGVHDVVFLNIAYENKVMANIHVSWLDPQKTRKMVVVGSRKMVVYDDAAEDKVCIYDKGIDRRAVLGENMDFDRVLPPQFSYRSGDIVIPRIDYREPLLEEAQHFVDCVRGNLEPLTGIEHARKVVHVLEQASQSKV